MIDLHIHSTFSDGKLNVKEIINDAITHKMSIISITDHDNIQSVQMIKETPKSNDLIFVPGVELSTVSYYFGKKMKVHILGYGFDSLDKQINQSIENMYFQRAEDNKEYVEQVIREFSFLSLSMFKDFDYGKYGWIRKLILNQISSSVNVDNLKILKEYLTTFKPEYHNYNFNMEEAIDVILRAGGYPVLAHPFKLNLDNEKIDIFLKHLVECGIIGIESYHNDAPREQINICEVLAAKYNLYESGGSDFHSYYYDKCLGTNIEELNSDLPFVKKLISENKVIGGR